MIIIKTKGERSIHFPNRTDPPITKMSIKGSIHFFLRCSSEIKVRSRVISEGNDQRLYVCLWTGFWERARLI